MVLITLTSVRFSFPGNGVRLKNLLQHGCTPLFLRCRFLVYSTFASLEEGYSVVTAEERDKLDWILFDSAAQSLVGMNGYEFIGRWACGALGEAAMLPGVWSLIVWLERAKPYVALANRAH